MRADIREATYAAAAAELEAHGVYIALVSRDVAEGLAGEGPWHLGFLPDPEHNGMVSVTMSMVSVSVTMSKRPTEGGTTKETPASGPDDTEHAAWSE